MLSYIVTATGSDGTMETITLPTISGRTGNGSFELCSNRYSFTVAADTNGGIGATSPSEPLFPGGNN